MDVFKNLTRWKSTTNSNYFGYTFQGTVANEALVFADIAAGIGRAALPIARKFHWLVIKKIGLQRIVRAASELIEVVSNKKSLKQAIKST